MTEKFQKRARIAAGLVSQQATARAILERELAVTQRYQPEDLIEFHQTIRLMDGEEISGDE